jgi:hypothetical protein
MSHLQIYYPECSQNEQKKRKKETAIKLTNVLEANEILQEHLLLIRIDSLPAEIQGLIANFSPIVAAQKCLVKFEFFDTWLNQNTQRIMDLLDGWTKPQVGFVLNSIIQLKIPDFDGYLKGAHIYQHWDAKYMRKQIKVHISHRTKIMRPDILADLRGECTYTEHKFVPCLVNPTFDECPPIRVWGAYKAIEEYDAGLKAKKSEKKSKAKK